MLASIAVGCTKPEPEQPNDDPIENPSETPDDEPEVEPGDQLEEPDVVPETEFACLSLSGGVLAENSLFEWEPVGVDSDAHSDLVFFLSDGENPIYCKISPEPESPYDAIYSYMTVNPDASNALNADFQTVSYYGLNALEKHSLLRVLLPVSMCVVYQCRQLLCRLQAKTQVS